MPFYLDAQIHKAPADTGKIHWGHEQFQSYNASMCDRAAREFVRNNSRKYNSDTILSRVSDDEESRPHLSEGDLKSISRCLSAYSPDSMPEEHLWGYVRAALFLDMDERVVAAVNRLISLSPDSLVRDAVYLSAIRMFISAPYHRNDLAHKYLNELDKVYSSPVGSNIVARRIVTQYWMRHYNRDSVTKYAIQSIGLVSRMDAADRDKMGQDAYMPYMSLIKLANDNGDISEQEMWLDSMAYHLSEWRGGAIDDVVSSLQREIDKLKSLYGRRSNPITEGRWFNTANNYWPVSGRISLMVWVDPVCLDRECIGKLQALRNIKEKFRETLDITLVMPSYGYAIGTLPLNEQEEGDSIVKLFSEVYGMPYPVVLDSRSMQTIPDGRIVRNPGVIADIFSEWRGVSAVVADREGRIQWMGSFDYANQLEAMLFTINRAISLTE